MQNYARIRIKSEYAAYRSNLTFMAFLLLILCIPSFAHAQRKEKKNTVNELIPIDCEDIVFSRDGRSILILEDDVNDFSIWDLQRNRLIKKVEVRRTLGDEHFSLGAQHVVARINPPDALCFLDISTGSFQIAKAPGSLEVDQISLNGKVEWLKDRGSHQLLRILSAPFDESSPSKTVELQGLENSFNDIQFMEFSPNGRVFAGRVRHEPGTFSLWDCATGKKIAQLPDAGLYFSNFGKDEYGFSPDGSVFYLMHRSRVELYDASDGHVIGGLQGQ